MKIKRYKKVKSILKFYSLNFGFRKPYQVLIDATLCFTALKYQVNIQEQLTKYLEEAKLLTTQCIILESEKLGSAVFGATLIVKKFPIHRCPHIKSPVSGSECILDMIKDKTNRYIVATQDRELQNICRSMEGIPLLYLHMKTPNLEAPSEMSQQKAHNLASTQMTSYEQQQLSTLNDQIKTDSPEIRKRKRKGGPNPLSCKKKKKNVENSNSKTKKPENEHTKKRKRKRNRFVQKVKKELMADLS